MCIGAWTPVSRWVAAWERYPDWTEEELRYLEDRDPDHHAKVRAAIEARKLELQYEQAAVEPDRVIPASPVLV